MVGLVLIGIFKDFPQLLELLFRFYKTAPRDFGNGRFYSKLFGQILNGICVTVCAGSNL